MREVQVELRSAAGGRAVRVTDLDGLAFKWYCRIVPFEGQVIAWLIHEWALFALQPKQRTP